jgi:predicted TIM-barrel fold metal-dependent hydrolase
MDFRPRYNGPIFDAHSHVVDEEHIDLLVRIGEDYGVEKSLLIVHGDVGIESYEERYPDRFIFAKYFSGWMLFGEGLDEAVPEIHSMREEGYQVAKVHFAPFWSDRLSEVKNIPPLDSKEFNPFFEALAYEEIPVLIHVSDPDTYYESRYDNEAVYGTKDEHLMELERRLERTPDVTFQVAHFGAQPEVHRLENLARLFDNYPNLNVDTGSARWMVRELGRDPETARRFVTRYSERILFGSDCVARSNDISYYEGRYKSERMLWESDVRDVPLPFVDADTVDSGGTFINGLNLDDEVLEKLYWKNALRIHM